MKKHYVITNREEVVSFEETSITRHIHCVRYDDCLGIAIKKGWRNFSCHKCPIFKEYLHNFMEK